MLKLIRNKHFVSTLKGKSPLGVLPCVEQVRWRRAPHQRHVYRDLYKRRLIAGPDPVRPRSWWIEWNYDSEIYCFGKRLGEDFKDSTLRIAFTHSSYNENKDNTSVKAPADPLPDNKNLIKSGGELINTFVKAYLRHHFPRLPEECVCSVHAHLTNDAALSNVASNIGIPDLILCAELPPGERTLADTWRAVVGALRLDQGDARAEKLVQDFVLTQLIGRDINEILGIVNPMGLLADLLKEEGRGEPEPRLLHASGVANIQAVYMVGIYSDRKLIGKSYGETSLIAEEMAARDALRNFFNTTIHREPLPYKEPVKLSNKAYQPSYSARAHISVSF